MTKSLRPYQLQAIANVEDNLNAGVDKQLLVLATGLGKTFTAVKVIEKLGFKKVLWITHTEELIEQSALAFLKDKFDDEFVKHVEAIGFIDWVEKHNCNFGNYSGTFKMGAIKASVFKTEGEIVMASAQTLYRRLDKIPADTFDCIITDEAHCFPKGSLVDGIPIEDIKIGDVVTSFNHDSHETERKKVLRLFKKEIESDLYKITLENGVEFICTEEHPIYTKELGYINAKSICDKQLHCLYLQNEKTDISRQNRNKLLNLFKRSSYNKKSKHKGIYKIQKSLLFRHLQKEKMEFFCKNIYSPMYNLWKGTVFYNKVRKKFLLQKKNLLQRFSKLKNGLLFQKEEERGYGKIKTSYRQRGNVKENEREKSYVKFRNEAENDKFFKGKNFFISWRKWRINKASNDVTFSYWFRHGIRYTYESCKRNVSKFTDMLQSRFSGSRIETCNRSGWKNSQIEEMEVFRQKKNGNFKFVRVASCEIYKRRNRSECGEGYEKTYVYNIEVEDNVNYFVENTLVHNCFAAETFCRPLNYFTPKLLLGLTATPHRNDNLMLGNIFDKIVYEYNIAEGIKDGYLCELDAVRVKTDLSLDNVRTTAGELNQKDLSNEVNIPKRNKLVVDSYLKYASGRQGIFYCVDVQHAVDLSEMFNSNGIACKPIVGDEEVTTDRKGWIRDFKDGKLQVLTNCMVLTTGYDHSNLGCVGNASPTKSLTKYLQCIGRATRLKDNEYVEKFRQEAIILDFVDNTSKHKLINCWELDKGKATEDKVFLTAAQKKNLIDERNRRNTKIESLFKKDERVKLLKLPEAVLNDSIRMREPATQAQLSWIEGLGYDVKNTIYTKAMCNEIISQLPANKVQVDYLKNKGYDVNEGATRGQYSMIEWKNRK